MTRFSPGRLLSARSRRGWILVAVGSATLLAGCHAKPAGQVVATVNGDEITLTELNAELANIQPPPGVDKQTLQRQALERIVERKLLAGAARQDGMDQNPEFIVRRQQLEDALLVQLMAQKIAGGIKLPPAGDIDKFIADNSNMFAGRTIFTVDQLQFDTPARDDYLKQLAATHSMADVIATLDKLAIKYQRHNAQVDSATVPPQALDQIHKLPTGEPFIVPAGGKVTVSVITGSQPAPPAADVARPMAINAVRNKQLGTQLQQRLSAERAKAQIQYGQGFGPPPKPGQASPPKSAAPSK